MKIFKVVVLLVILSGKCISQTKQPNSPLIEKISSILFNRSRDFVFIVLPVYFDNSKQQQNLVTDNFAVRKYLQFKDSLLFKNKSKLDSLISNVLIEKDKLIIRKVICDQILLLFGIIKINRQHNKYEITRTVK